MPTQALKKMTKKRGLNTKVAEKFWKEAKKSANEAVKKGKFEAKSERYWAYVMSITKKRLDYEKKNKKKAKKVTAGVVIAHLMIQELKHGSG